MTRLFRNLLLIVAILVLPIALSACTTTQAEPAKPCEACMKHDDVKCDCKTCKKVKGVNKCKSCQCVKHEASTHAAPVTDSATMPADSKTAAGKPAKKCHCPEKH